MTLLRDFNSMFFFIKYEEKETKRQKFNFLQSAFAVC